MTVKKIHHSKRTYKDTLFRAIFGRPEHKNYLLSLYNAINHSAYTNPDDLELTTLDDVIYIKMKNDLSFLIDNQMSLYEHQSTYNPNMPIRGFLYFSELYQAYLKDSDLYAARLVKIPTPRFIVFYNGKTDTPDIVKMYLSDAFEVAANDGKPKLQEQTSCKEFEWTATMYNINHEHNRQLLEQCKALQDYMSYVTMVRRNQEAGMDISKAVDTAVEQAIKQNLLDGFFKKQKAEVKNMILTEFDEEQFVKNRIAEGIEIGKTEGIEIGKTEGIEIGKHDVIQRMLVEHMPISQIAQLTGVSEAEIQNLIVSAHSN